MTIATGLLAHDGVVLGADSTVTVSDAQGRMRHLFAGGQKVFQLGMDRHYGFLLFGPLAFGTRSYRDLLVEFDASLGPDNPPLRELAERFLAFAWERWPDATDDPDLEFPASPGTGLMIGGIGDSDRRCSFAYLHSMVKEADDRQALLHITQPGGFIFDGCPSPASRLVYGFDDVAWSIVSPFIPGDQQQAILDQLQAPSEFRAAPSPTLPLRDALDYVHWIVYSTIKYYKFTELPTVCGGKVELACVTSDRGFRWITHKSLDWSIGDVEGQTEYSPLDPHHMGR